MSMSSGVEDALKIMKKLKNCDTLSEADLLEALSRLPCPKRWNVGDLHAALLAGWGEVVREMVEVLCGYDKVLCGRLLASLLFIACFSGDLSVVRFLVSEVKCWSVHDTAESNATDLCSLCLLTACQEGHLEVLRCLVEHTNAPLPENLLALACDCGYLDVVKYLVTQSNQHDVPLLLACKQGHLDVVRYLVTEAHADPNVTGKNGLTPLHMACMNGHLNVVEYLVTEACANPNVTTETGLTPLHMACDPFGFASGNSHLEIIKCLISDGHVDPNFTDEDGRNPLHYACQNGDLDVIKYLVTETQAQKVFVRNFVAVKYVETNTHDKSTKSLVTEVHGNPNITDKYGLTPLYIACENGHLDVVKYLIVEAHYDPLFINKYGSTPLHSACKEGQLDVVKYLVTEIYVDPNVTNINGSTPLHLACRNGHLNVVKCLATEVRDVNPNATDNSGFTPLHCALEQHAIFTTLLKICSMDEGLEVLRQSKDDLCIDSGPSEFHLFIANNRKGLTYTNYFRKTFLFECYKELYRNPNISDDSDSTPLYLACKIRRLLDVIEYLLVKGIADPNIANKHDLPLHLACRKGDLDAVKCLVAADADPNHVSEKSGSTPLYFACEEGHLDIVKYLIAKGHVDTNGTYHGAGLTLLHLVCNYWQGPVHWWDHFHKSFLRLAPEQHQYQLDVVKHLISKAHLDPNTASSHGLTPLHLALMNGCPDVAEYLLTEANVDPSVADASDITPLHLACYFGYLDIVKILVTKAQVNPNAFDKYGLTPLHLASASGHTNVVQHLVTDSVCIQPNIVANKRCGSCGYACLVPCINRMVPDCGYSAPLHLASINGHINVVKCLVTQACADPNVKDKQGSTPLQLACQYGHLDVAKYLITQGNADPNSKDEFGLTPLHYTCGTDHPELVEWLFKTVNGDLVEDSSSPNTSKIASLSDDWHVIGDVPAASKRAPFSDQWYLIRLFLENGATDYQFLPNLKILVVDNASAGKSTLVKALQDKFCRKGLLDKFTSNFRTVSGVELKTAGIVPTTIQTESFGYITFYDFAGQCEYYSSHAAMLKNLTSSLDSLVLIVIDLSQDIDKVNTALNYWNRFVSNLTADKDSKPHQQIVFTHSDLLSDSPMLRVNLLKKLDPSNSEMLDSSIVINCTKASSNGLTFVHNLVRNNCSKLQSEIKQHKMSPFFAASNYFMSGFCADKVSFPLEVLLDKFNNVPLPLVKHLLHTLSKQGKILFLENDVNIESSWIILDVQTLMAEVNGTIFSPENFKQHHDMSSSTGVVPLSAISTVFSDHNKKMIVDFLCHFEFCHKIASTEANLIGRSQEDAVRHDVSEESYYFFPALVRTDRPVEVFSTPGLSYKFGWFLKCNDGDFLFPRFPHILVLRLAFSFALAPDPEDVDTSCPVLQRKCDVWKCGISWQNRDGVEVVVEVVEESTAVVVVVGCLEGREWAGMRLRSEVIRTVFDVKEEHAKETEMSERFVHPKELGSYPLSEVDKLLSFTMHEISCVIANGQHVVTSKRCRHMISLKELLFFEPYSCFGHEIISELFNEVNLDVTVSETFLYDAGKSVQLEDHVTVQESLKMILPLKHSDLVGLIAACDEQYKNDPAHQCYLILRVWKKGHCNPTYSALREALNGYSIFAGKNPLRPSSSP